MMLKFAPMFKKLVVICLLLAFSGQTFANNLFQLDYRLNRAAFEQKCINKYRPWLHCNGKCQLMKKLIEKERKDQENNDRKPEAPAFVYCEQQPSWGLSQPGSLKNKMNFTNNSPSLTERSYSIFHPPRC